MMSVAPSATPTRCIQRMAGGGVLPQVVPVVAALVMPKTSRSEDSPKLKSDCFSLPNGRLTSHWDSVEKPGPCQLAQTEMLKAELSSAFSDGEGGTTMQAPPSSRAMPPCGRVVQMV